MFENYIFLSDRFYANVSTNHSKSHVPNGPAEFRKNMNVSKIKYWSTIRIFDWKNNKNTNNAISIQAWQVLKNRNTEKRRRRKKQRSSLLPPILSRFWILCSRFNLFGNFRFPIPFHLVRCSLSVWHNISCLCTGSVTFSSFHMHTQKHKAPCRCSIYNYFLFFFRAKCLCQRLCGV